MDLRYLGMGNGFVNGVDPNGGLYFSVGGAIVGAVIGGTVAGVAGYIFDRDHWQQWAAIGATVGGLYGGFTSPKLEFSVDPGPFRKRCGLQIEQALTGDAGGHIGERFRRIGYHLTGMNPEISPEGF